MNISNQAIAPTSRVVDPGQRADGKGANAFSQKRLAVLGLMPGPSVSVKAKRGGGGRQQNVRMSLPERLLHAGSGVRQPSDSMDAACLSSVSGPLAPSNLPTAAGTSLPHQCTPADPFHDLKIDLAVTLQNTLDAGRHLGGMENHANALESAPEVMEESLTAVPETWWGQVQDKDREEEVGKGDGQLEEEARGQDAGVTEKQRHQAAMDMQEVDESERARERERERERKREGREEGRRSLCHHVFFNHWMHMPVHRRN